MHAPICPDCRVQLELSHLSSYGAAHSVKRIYIVGVCPECKFTFKGVGKTNEADQIISVTADYGARRFAQIGAPAYLLHSPSIYSDYSPGTHELAD